MSDRDPLALAAEVESLANGLQALPPSPAREQAERLVAALASFYGAGLARMLEIVRQERGPDATLHRFSSDPLVVSLLSLHDLQPAASNLIQIMRPSTGHDADRAAVRQERCELCGTLVAAVHAHVVDTARRQLLCACATCSTVGGRYPLVPSRYVHTPDMTMTPEEWDTLGVPVGVAFFVRSSALDRVVACYPGPAGVAESLLSLDTWPDMAASRPWMRDVAADVEALLVRRFAGEYRFFIVPIDACYELAGRIRNGWTGLSGGALIDAEIDRFFQSVVDRARGTEAVA